MLIHLILATLASYAGAQGGLSDNSDKCFMTVAAREGFITSPGYPSSYTNNLNCTYVFVGVRPTQIISLRLYELDVERCSGSDPGCDCDWLSIDGRQKLCQNTTFQESYVFRDRFVILFRSDGSGSGRGFQLRYSVGMDPHDNCTFTLTNKTGEITSPGYPDYYINSLYCKYVFVGEGHSQIITIDLLDLDLYYCFIHNEWLIIDDGTKLCLPTTFHKTYVFRDRFIISFQTFKWGITSNSIYSSSSRGFKLHYSVGMEANDTCTSIHTKTSGQISRPCSSCNCADNNCTNTIIGSGKLQTLILDFVSLNFMTKANCDAGWFTIGGGPRICTSEPFKTIYVFHGSVDIVTHGGQRSVSSCPGFIVNYAVQDNCSATFTASEGEIASPGYPGNFTDNMNCTYVIVGDGRRQIITIDPLELDLTDCSYYRCHCDWFIIGDGPKLCHDTTFQKTYVFRDRFIITFGTDIGSSRFWRRGRRFRMHYSIGTDVNDKCTSTHIKTSGQISTPCSSCNCSYNNCTNTIMGSGELQTLTLDFVSLNAMASTNCDMGWFTMGGGPKICTSAPFKTTYAFLGSLDIVTHGGDRSVNSCPGFVVNYAVQDNCTTTFTASEGEITSPGYPGIWIVLSCTYVIVGDEHTQIISLDLVEFDRTPCWSLGIGCTCDWLIINDGPTVCGITRFQKKYVFQDRFVIKYRTDYRESSRGFRMRYSLGTDANETCTSTHIKTSGQISTPCSSCNCTFNHCTNTIVGSGKLQAVILDFVSLNFTTSAYCTMGWFTIDGGKRICTSTPFKTAYAFYGSIDIVTHGRDRSVSSCPGFIVNYAVQDNCSVTLTASEGLITSPPNPGTESIYISCTYIIVGDGSAQSIAIDLLEINLEEGGNCYYDWLIIHDGPKLCYHTTFRKTYAFRNRFIIKFRSSYFNTKEFKIYYSVGMGEYDTCSSIHTKTSGQISTPCYSCNCTYNNCTNTIMGSWTLKILTLDFVSLNFTTSPNCDAGWFTIDGGPKICPSRPFKTIYAFYGSIDIVTHGGDRSRDTCPNFVVNYDIQDVDNNTLTYNTNSGQLVGPIFPGNGLYSFAKLTCIIVGRFPSQNLTLDITLTFHYSGKCTYNRLTLNNTEELCRTGTYHRTYLSQNNFITELANTYGAGFVIQYKREDIIEGKPHLKFILVIIIIDKILRSLPQIFDFLDNTVEKNLSS